jgi:hypothetical protein
MEKVRFLLFKKKSKDQLDRSLLFLTLFVTGLAFLWLGGENYFGWEVFETLGLWILGITGLAYGFFGFYSLSEKEKLNGDFTGYIEFENEKITVGDQEFYLDNLSKIEIYAEDYNGKKDTVSYSVMPKVSNGVKNLLRLKTKDSLEFVFNFQLNFEKEFERKMKDLLIHYHLQDKISFLVLIQHIGISDNYEQIQKFKMDLEKMKA